MVADRHSIRIGPARYAALELVAGPVLFALGAGIMYFVREIGPLDLAKVQGLVALPLLALGPAVAGLAGRSQVTRATARTVISATAAVVGWLTVWAVAESVTFARCRPVTTPVEILPELVVMGVLGGATYWFAGTVALRSAASGSQWIALAKGAGTFLLGAAVSVGVLFLALFPPLSCAPPH